MNRKAGKTRHALAWAAHLPPRDGAPKPSAIALRHADLDAKHMAASKALIDAQKAAEQDFEESYAAILASWTREEIDDARQTEIDAMDAEMRIGRSVA